MIALQILGFIFLIVLIIVGYFVFRVWRGIRRLKNNGSHDFVQLLSVLPPINFNLEPLDPSEWLHPTELKANNALLSQLGFKSDGLHQCFLGDVEAHIAIWWHPEKHLTAVMYEVINHNDESADPFMYSDVLINTSEGIISVNNNAIPSVFPTNKRFKQITVKARDLRELLAGFKKALPTPVKLLPITSGKDFYVHATQQYNRWLWQKPQLTSTEMQSIYDQLGIELTDELLETILDHAREEANEQLQEQLISIFTQRSKISAAQWEKIRDRLVIVHDDMTSDDLYQSLYQLFSYDLLEPIEDQLDTLQDSELSHTPTQELAKICQSFNLELPKRIAKLKSPVEAHFYLGEPV